MEELKAELTLLKEQSKILLDQNSSKPQTVMKVKSKIRHPNKKCGRSVRISPRAPVQADITFLPEEVLRMVMKKLDTKSIKNSRLVCHLWNLHVTPVLANQTTINVCKFFPWDEGDQQYKLKFPHKDKITTSLIRNIYYNEVDCEMELLTAFCAKYTNEVKGLKFNGLFIDNENLLVLYRMLTELCPNLQDLCVDEIDYDNEQGKLTQEQMSFEFSKPLALKVLRLRKDLYNDDERTKVLPPLSNFLDNVIHASKQLETLEVDLEYCPKELSNLTKLKTLDFRRMPFSKIKSIKLPYQNYIETLSISAPQENNSQSKDKTTEKYQQFPALRNLKIQSQYCRANPHYHLFFINDGKPEASNSAYYMLERSPVLKSLTIVGDGTVVNSLKPKMLRDLFHKKPAGRAFSRLSTLKFWGINFKDQELFQSIVNLTDFPNLTTLEFSICKYASLQDSERDLKAAEWFETLAKLKLVHLAINMHCKVNMSNIASGISENPSLLRGLETLKITSYNRGFGADDLHESPEQMAAFQKALKMTSTLKQVQFLGFQFQMRDSTLRTLMDFVTKNRLPVEIDLRRYAYY